MKELQTGSIIKAILSNKKYRALDIPEETIYDLLEREMGKGQKRDLAIKQVKMKLHNIIAPYLDRLDYADASSKLEKMRSKNNTAAIHALCKEILRAHDSTGERMSYFEPFYEYLFSKLKPNSMILDLACGLNPFFFPIIPTPKEMNYFAFDIHGPRIDLLNQLFHITNLPAKAIKQDILVASPEQKADAAFLFKEAHRIEKRESGGTRRLIKNLHAAYIFISLPTHSLNGRFDLRERMQRLVEKTIEQTATLEETREFESEMIYVIRKNNG